MAMHEPGIIHTWTFDQTEKWVDVNGDEHLIALIDREYALNIYVFLLRGASRFRCAYDRQHGITGRAFDAPEYSYGAPFEWMQSRPIISALRRRILTGHTAFKVGS